ncbi:hypothetical protein ABIF61_007914 [Bradyrhizobium japonicum]
MPRTQRSASSAVRCRAGAHVADDCGCPVGPGSAAATRRALQRVRDTRVTVLLPRTPSLRANVSAEGFWIAPPSPRLRRTSRCVRNDDVEIVRTYLTGVVPANAGTHNHREWFGEDRMLSVLAPTLYRWITRYGSLRSQGRHRMFRWRCAETQKPSATLRDRTPPPAPARSSSARRGTAPVRPPPWRRSAGRG